MRTLTEKNSDSRFPRSQWILEVIVFAIVSPALVYGVLSLNQLPIA